jgi:exodeoxyribonuclease VII small subunit
MAKAASTVTAALPATPATYEDALGELERLVEAMEAGHLPLDRLLESYRRGAELLAFCRTRLEAVEQQVKVLEDGQLKAFAPAGSSSSQSSSPLSSS